MIKRSKQFKTNDWETWVDVCYTWMIDPKDCEFSIDIGGGDTLDYEFTGEVQ